MTEKLEPALISATDAAVRVEGGARLIDVRSEKGRSAAGALPGADIVDRDRLEETFAGVSRDQPVVVVCGSVNGSGPVADWLVGNGFVDVAHVDGGFPAWKDSGLPVGEPAEPAAG
ncbi:rhodanese-like domain-containing protein [Leifsonia sp. TF02-11]|uniref:rhodanese-like domain-containing protein n=1 Tax=Leifsonia sp. TF02-11 TaxID=2815212 RepID=UPI001AA1669F|nr:rhodanese-like domain-containing protein [Leifsonia sp. TF02-11]MBO1739239.1 sulfurtransferase [Leifsonia sp. TF02-11]